MNRRLPWFTIPVFIVMATFPCPSCASGPSTLQEQIEYSSHHRSLQEAAIGEAQRNADLIFSAYARDSWKDHEHQRVYVEFEIETVHRGVPSSTFGYYDRDNSARPLSFESDSEEDLGLQRILIGHHYDKIDPFNETFRYLVYMQGDRIIRQTLFTDWVLLLSAEDELEGLHSSTSSNK